MADLKFWSIPVSLLYERLDSKESGLDNSQVRERLKLSPVKTNQSNLSKDITLLWSQFKSPLVLILIGAISLALYLGDYTNSVIVLCIVVLSSVLGFVQERNAGRAIERLQKLVKVTATVKREGQMIDVPIENVVPGDIVVINAGDIIPGDGRLLSCNDLHINEATLTGESFPAEKSLGDVAEQSALIQRRNSVFKGTSVVNGTGTVLVAETGANTVLGKIAESLDNGFPVTAFEKGANQFGYLLLQLTLTFSLIILLLNLYMGRPVIDSALFALALAVGITPELLPAIITISLSKGAKRMAEKKVIVKKLSAIHNLGSLDVFCIDKTGTLTEGIVKVDKALDVFGNTSEKALRYAVYNATHETGFSNPIDEALRLFPVDASAVTKVDEVPYDFLRKRLSVVVKIDNKNIMITKGALKNIMEVCTHVDVGNEIKPFGEFRNRIDQDLETFGSQGFRTIGICYKDVTNDPIINKDDETGMIFLGCVLLSDPPKLDVAKSLKKLNEAGVQLKLITGDNSRVAIHLGNIVGLDTRSVIKGEELRSLSDEALTFHLNKVSIFAETEPDQKERIVRTLQKSGHTVGFVGDGINDVSAIRKADVGISVESATDVAKNTADIVLLEKGLEVLYDGIIEGRKTFINSLKYIFTTTSANFGNMFSVAGASLFLVFLPLLPKQILLINFLTDLPAMALASDAVDSNALEVPRKWNNKLIRDFMIVFGLQSTFFDFLTFFVLYKIFQATPEQFQTGWFLECILTELFILMVLRTRKPFYKDKPGKYLLIISLIVGAAAFVVVYSPLNTLMGFVTLRPALLFTIALIVGFYIITAEITKRLFFRIHI
jgi:Mg2+-importing ATPase